MGRPYALTVATVPPAFPCTTTANLDTRIR